MVLGLRWRLSAAKTTGDDSCPTLGFSPMNVAGVINLPSVIAAELCTAFFDRPDDTAARMTPQQLQNTCGDGTNAELRGRVLQGIENPP